MMSAQIVYFLATILVTLLITAWAARRGADRSSLYVASSSITGTQNGIAIAGDTLSAGTILGYVGLYFYVGVDIALYSIASLTGLLLVLIFIAKPLRKLGRFTLGDVVGSRHPERDMRAVVGVCALTISLLYLIAQLVGAGAVISTLFGLSFERAVMIVGGLMATYVVFGGMLAATWVQIIKAILLMAMICLLSVLAIAASGGLGAMYARAAAVSDLGPSLFSFGNQQLTLFSSASVAVGMMLGFLGMPHVLIRFFTVSDEAAAKRSLGIATMVIGMAFTLVFAVLSPAAVALLSDIAWLRTDTGAIEGGPNMISLHLARFLGGDVLFGIMSATVFATILAVVAGLTVALSSAAAHDLATALRRSTPLSEAAELTIFRIAAFLFSALAVAVSILFRNENLIFLIVMANAVAASTTCPLLVMTIYWPRLTVAGAMAGGLVGLVASVGLIILGPACWVGMLGHAEPLFPSDYPALVSAPLSFVTMWLVSHLTGSNTKVQEIAVSSRAG